MRLWICCVFITLGGCSTQPREFVPIDGRAITPEQFQVDRLICQGEMQKANLASTAEAGIGRGRAVVQVFDGCMAQRGYMPK